MNWLFKKKKPPKPEDIQCPVCGYYCLGKGGTGCIDKPTLVHPVELENLDGVTYRRIYFANDKPMDIRISWNKFVRKHKDPPNCTTVGWLLLNANGVARRVEP